MNTEHGYNCGDLKKIWMLTNKYVKIKVVPLVYSSFTLRLVCGRASAKYIVNNARTILGSMEVVLKMIDALAISPWL